MHRILHMRLPLTWLILCAITLVSWWIGARQDGTAAGIVVFTAIILIATVKVRVIFWEFMEVRTAPARLKRMADAWLALLLAALLAAYLIASRYAS
jgi:hypothetical protein